MGECSAAKRPARLRSVWIGLIWIGVWRWKRLVLLINGRDVQEVGETLDPVLAARRNYRFGNLGGNPGDGSKGALIGRLEIDSFLAGRVYISNRRIHRHNSRPTGIENAIPIIGRIRIVPVVFFRIEKSILIGVFAEQKLASDATDHQKFSRGLERAIAWKVGRLKRNIILRFRSTRRHCVIVVPPVEDCGNDIRGHSVEHAEFISRGLIHVEAALFIGDAEK